MANPLDGSVGGEMWADYTGAEDLDLTRNYAQAPADETDANTDAPSTPYGDTITVTSRGALLMGRQPEPPMTPAGDILKDEHGKPLV